MAGGPNDEAGVDLGTGTRFGDGHERLCAVFTDTQFDPDQHAYYYLRAIELPSVRWSVFDCLRLPEADRPAVCGPDSEVPKIIQEMAWSSPIWVGGEEPR